MIIYQGKNGAYPNCPTRFLGLEEFFKVNSDNCNLVIGGGFDINEVKAFKKENPDKKMILIEFDEPNRFFYTNKHSINNKFEYQDSFDLVFTICPYTAEWLNKKFKNGKRKAVFFPFNENFLPKTYEKKYDVIYTGHILAKPILEIAEIISKFNYIIVSNSEHKLVNRRSVDLQEKMNLIGQSKITIVQNLHYMDPFHIANLQLIDDYKDSKAYELVPARVSFKANQLNVIIGAARRVARKLVNKFYSHPIDVPQIKSRAFEAAFGRSLMLVQKDHFNVIELFFTPEIEFIYYEKGTLETTIREILTNYEKYAPVIENAYNRAKRDYTSKQFYKKYLEEYDR